MKHSMFQWLLILCMTVVLAVSQAAATRIDIPRLSPTRGVILEQPEILKTWSCEECQTFYYNQTLDHFNYRPESYTKFQQRYVMNFQYWGGPNAPILAYLGAESSIDSELAVVGFVNDTAPQLKALQVFIEHRYYGKSIPFGSIEEVMKNASTRGYFSSAQAIADYAQILLHIKKKLHAQHSPVIVTGGSYGGMLASWFRLKYPHITIGALASSAPILYFDNITLTPPGGYYSVVTKDFKEASETCYQTIRNSWSVIQHHDLDNLSQKFKTCKPLTSASELKYYLMSLYTSVAQYNHPPVYPVTVICDGIDGAANSSSGNEDDILLDKIFAGVVAYKVNETCYVNPPRNRTENGWRWQRCSEMVMPIGIGNDTMFPPSPFNLSSFENACKSIYGVPPRPHWITSYYGGHDIKFILQRFGSNIIFSNGLRDPYSSGGVLESISTSIVAVTTKNGSHCLDLHSALATDPPWLVEQRATEVKIIQQWLANYFADLRALIKH
ncbi:hypothetical protein SLEP1_g7510 [Rubroshorea leprosula]|uniref:Lysosomal Pro-X carboxypeptidase n=1 Tax=Rubroshorea leprosula TaxID=152421 RepID=A0AAV5I6Y9_9ROSI|nr:hypothetical protein SLEP1_g7510 [Rubroshorea leprosula]